MTIQKSYKFLWYWLPVLLWVGFIVNLSLRANPARVVPERVSSQVTRSLPKPIKTDQAGHVLEYSVLSVLLLRAVRRYTARGVLVALAGTLIVAVLDETLQEFIPGRAFQLTDLALDSVAALFGAAIFLFFTIIARPDAFTGPKQSHAKTQRRKENPKNNS